MKKERFLQKASLHARLSHPVFSAYEFELIRKDESFQKIIESSSLYIIAQRPLLKIRNIAIVENNDKNDSEVYFEIYDNSNNESLKCFVRFNIEDCLVDDDVMIRRHYFEKNDMLQKKNEGIAAIELLDNKGGTVFYISPQRFLYFYFNKKIIGRIDGELHKYIDYEVHYIGQSFEQEIWQRLTGHEKLQKIMTLQRPLDTLLPHAPFEISLMLLSVESLEVASIFDPNGFFSSNIKKPIYHDFSKFERIYDLDKINAEHTNEFEAALINVLKPTYNSILYKNYPFIKKGLRSQGYSDCEFIISHFPVLLYTKHAVLPPVFEE